jgi:AmmeMemoRadiSam system protein A
VTHPRNPYLTVDVIVETPRGIVLVLRAREPRGWALPGGFVEYGEDPASAARREVKEETGLDVELSDLLGVYGAPDRDPRQHNVSIVYVGRASGEPAGGDDAARAEVFSLDALPRPLCFDHDEIVRDYTRFRESGARPEPARTAGAELRPHRATLLRAARDAISSAVTGRAASRAPSESDPVLQRRGASFVTLRMRDGSLRGCIGELDAQRPLVESVRGCAISAALRDPRFPPVSEAELDHITIGVSVLTPPAPVRPEDVVVGRHGLIVELGRQRGVLLPEVATENGWDREEFLAYTCRKAGLPADAWRSPAARLSAFETVKIAED